MATGRKTGGRQKGTPNRRTAEQAAIFAASGLTPLAFMMDVLCDETASMADRMDAAKAAAPYVHARLSQVEMQTTTVPYDAYDDDALYSEFATIAARIADGSRQLGSRDRATQGEARIPAKPH